MIMQTTSEQMDFLSQTFYSTDNGPTSEQPPLHQHFQEGPGEYRQKRIIWLASESWDRNNPEYTVGTRRLAAQGAIVLMLESQRVPSFEDYYLSLYPGKEKFERNKWLRELWRHKFNCEVSFNNFKFINKRLKGSI